MINALKNKVLDIIKDTPLSKLLKSCRKKLQSGKIDFVVKVFLYKGGDIDFVKTARDEDGKAEREMGIWDICWCQP